MALYDPSRVAPTMGEAVLRLALTPEGAAQIAGGLADVTAEQVHNLALLAQHLRGLPEEYDRFNMGSWFRSDAGRLYDDGADPSAAAKRGRQGTECGTVACAVGHGPAAGVDVLPGDGSWNTYAYRAFGGPVFNAAFQVEWQYKDNTPRGAAARILYVLAGRNKPGAKLAPHHDPELYAEFLA